MAQRPADWSAIGLGGDPTPGDPDRIEEVARSLGDLGRVAREIDDELNAVLDKTGGGAFVGQTADALRDKISGPLRGFVQSVAEAFESSARALTDYAGVLRDQQWRADNALDQGRGLAEDDPRRAELAATARQAGEAQAEAGTTAGGTVSRAARGIKQPVSDCDLFWEVFNWLAIILIIPALIFGGPVALLAIGVNLTLFIKTAVDFAHGKASLLDLFLSGLGMIAPTTKGIPLLKLISSGAKLTWQGIKNVGKAVFTFFRDVFTGGGLRSFAFLPGLRDFASLASNWVRSGSLWVLGSIAKLPAWAGMAFETGGLTVIQGIKGLPALVRGLPTGLLKVGTAGWKFAQAELGGGKWLRLVLPVDAAEIGAYGIKGALRIGVLERGLLGNFRYGAPLLGTAGRTVAAIPVPPPLHQVDALVDLPRSELARVRLGDWAGPRGLDIPSLSPGGPGASFSRPPAFTVHSALGEQLSFAPDALRRLDALLDTPIRELNSVRMGDWTNLATTPTGLRLDAGPGIGAHSPTGLGDLAVHAGTPGLQTPSPHLPGTGTLTGGTVPTAQLPSFQTQATALHQPGTLQAPSLGTPALQTAVLRPTGVQTADLLAPPAVTAPAHPVAVQPPGLGGTARTPLGLPPVAVPGGQLHSALELLSSSAVPHRADLPSFGGGSLTEHTTQAMTAHQVTLHLDEFAPPRTGAGPGTLSSVSPPPVPHPASAATTLPPVRPGLAGPNAPHPMAQTAMAQTAMAQTAVESAHTAPPAPQLGGGGDRAGSALGLLDGGGRPPRTETPALAGAPGTGIRTAAAPPPPAAAVPPPTPHSPALAPGSGPGRLTGAQLDRLWQQQSDRVAALFGAAGDPARPARLQAWQDLTLARHDRAVADRLLTELHARPGSGSQGPGPAHLQAQQALDSAEQRIDRHLAQLTALGVDPAAIDHGLAELTAQSLRERPRLLGGSGGSGSAGTSAHVVPAPQPVRLALSDSAVAGPNGWTVETVLRGDGTPHHRLLDPHGHPEPLLRPVARPDGGFDVHNSRLGTVQTYDPHGRLTAEDTPLSGLDGAPTGLHVHADFDGRGRPTYQVRDAGGGPLPLEAAPRPGGGFDLRDPLDGSHRGFDPGGALVEEGRPLLGADGTPLGPVLILSHDNGVVTRSLAQADGQTLHVLDAGAGLRVTDPVGGRSVRFDAQGGYVEQGIALTDAAGARGTRFAVPDGTGGHLLTDAAGNRLPGRLTALPDGGLRFIDDTTGASVRYGADGTRVETGLALADPHGVRGTQFLTDRGPHTVTDAAGHPTGHTADPLPGGGWRVTDPVGGRSVRFDAQGGYLEQGIALTDAAGARGTRFAVPDGTGGHLLTDAAGNRLPERVTAHPGGGFRVEQPPAAPGTALRYQRYAADGSHTGHGRQLLDQHGHPAGYLDHRVGGRPHPLAPGPQWLDGGFHADPGRPVVAEPGGGFRVGDPAGGYRVFDGATGRLTEDATRLRGPGGEALDRWITARHPQGGGPPTLHVVDGTGAVQPHLTVTERPGGVHQISDTQAGGSFVRHRPNGTRLESGAPLRGPDGNPDGTFAVLPEPGPAGVRAPGRLEDAAGNPVAHRTATLRPDGGVQVSVSHPGSPRHGEYRVHAAADGALTHQGFNVLKDGRRTDHQYVVDHTAPGGATWRRAPHPDAPHPDAPHPAPDAGGAFHHGTVEVGADGSRVRLLSSTGNRVEVFERRALPGGGVLDSFRRTDTVAFGDFTRSTTWAHWDDSGALAGRGTRRYDTSGFGWKDVDHRGRTVHEYREGLQKTGGRSGSTLAVRDGGTWTWHRFDGTGREIASGPRTVHTDGGWVDRLPDGTLVQRQWGPLHTPEHAGHYQEYRWENGAVRPDWERQSPQGKESGKRETLPDGGVRTTTRWSEQRPPLWVRKALIREAAPQGAFHHLRSDDRFQVFLWTKEGGRHPGGGLRYAGMDGGVVDLGADGRFVGSTGKLHGGATLKVGDHAAPPAQPPTDPAHLPWEEPGRRGLRVPVDPGGHADRPVWQDRFRTPEGEWRVAREGFPDGSVREYRTPPRVDPVTGQVDGRLDGAWVQRDAHGTLTGVHGPWTGPGGHQVRVTGVGRADSADWRWTAVDQLGVETSGRRLAYRGSGDPRLPWDDSFRDFDGTGALVRGRDMLDGGRHVDFWRGTDPVTGEQRWYSRKFDAAGTAVDYGAGQQLRRWWNPATRTWDDRWSAGARHFRDDFHPAGGGPAVIVREVPPHLPGDGPLRVREYWGGGAVPAPGTWKEFDHGAVVRERSALGGGFLEKDAWRGQWRRYDAHGTVLAQRTDSGLVFEGGPDRLRITGNEYDFRGPLTEIRGWGRRVREAQRMPWGGSASVPVPEFRAALDGVPGLPAAVGGRVPLGEALYQPYWSTLAKKVALEFGQEFVLEFGANLAANGIAAAVNHKPFTGKDALKSFANAAVGAGVKGVVGTAVHEIRGSRVGQAKSVLGNVDGGKLEFRRPNNHDKHWANEWAGNESPTRWRGGTYDFFYNSGVGALSGWINGSMNAAVWGVTGADGKSHVLTGMDAFLDGGIASLSALTTAGSTALARNLVLMGGGSRFFHRQGFGEFWLQLPFKIFEKTVNTLWLAPAIRHGIDPSWYRAPDPQPPQSPQSPQQGN
ncbi:hypothetical protein ACIQGZ_28805 [Streptomyces sp. NPDC092296]|uniref:hypothetical protein n=1 Tax=Streptomyces sp. NPDC092296 TaxID=3366012 RepID=UPI00382AB4A8